MAYTWGQLRLLLQQDFPSVSLDKLDERINARYAMILSLQDWKGLEKKSTLETVASIQTGTLTTTQGSVAVQGQSTGWTSAITGMQLVVQGSTKLYTVTYVDATDLTLDRPFEDTSVVAGGYTLLQSVYQLPDDCRQLRVIQNPYTGVELGEMTELEFAREVGIACLQAWTSDYFVPQPDQTDPETGATVQAIQLYPLPTQAQGYPIVYEQVAAGFDGVTTTAGPLAFVSDFAILEGARADLYEDPAKVAKHEGLYQKHLQGMIHQDNGRRASEAPKIDPAYTRHRDIRILRQFGGRRILRGW